MNQYPLIKINIIFIIGIIIQNSINVDYLILLITAFALLILSLFLILLKLHKTLVPVLIILILSAGALACFHASSGLKHYPFKLTKIKNSIIYGNISNIQPAGSYELKFRIHTDSVLINNKRIIVDHDFLCRIRDTLKELKHLSNMLAPGNHVVLSGTISKAAGERNPGEFNYYNYLHREKISALFTSYDVEDVRVINSQKDYLKNLIYYAQRKISEPIGNLLNDDSAALLKGLILADRSGIDPEIIDDFINSGVIHILSVSGLHIGYVVLIFIFLTGRMSFRLRVPLIISGIIIYTAITGAPPSVLRAAFMSIVIFIALLTNRSTNLLNTLSFACLLFLIYNPLDLFHPGFQLSYSAVGAIALFYHYFGESFRQMAVKHKLLSGISVFFLISLFAQAGTIPFTIYYFGKISVVSLLANVFVIPATGIILGAGIFMLVVNAFWTTGALIYASAVNFLVYLLYNIVHLFSDNEWSYFNINQFSITDAVIFYSFMITLLLLAAKFRSLPGKIILTLLILLNIILFCSIDDENLMPDNKLSIVAIDVEQGDAFLIKFPNGKTALIDAGESTRYFDNGRRVIMPLIERLGVDKIDYGFISHMDVDHYEGFISLLENGNISEIYKPDPIKDFRIDQALESWLKNNGIPITHYEKKILKENNIRMYILNDPENTADMNINNRSGVIKLVYGKTSILFTGDTESKGERFLMLRYGSFLKSDILKLGHHGSKTGTSDPLLEVVKPAYALISAGANNKFNHPSPETLRRLRRRKIQELRTDVNGAIVITSDGSKIDIVKWK